MFHRLLALIKKELQALLRDPNSRSLIILPVIIQLALFSFAATLEVKNNTIAIYNLDSGSHSIELMQRFAKAKPFTKVKMLYGIKEVDETINNQHALLVVIFPITFSRGIASGTSATLQVIFDGRRSNAAQIAASYLDEIVDKYKRELNSNSTNRSQISNISVRNWFNPNLEYKWFVLPGLVAICITIGCLIVTALSVAREKEQGTFEQLLVSPLTAGYIMIGKIVPALIIGLIQASIIIFASIFLYRIPLHGSFILLYFCLLCYGLSLAGVGLLISSVCATQQQALLGVFGFIVPGILLSGYVSPIENIPEPLRLLTWMNPVRHFFVISKGIYLKGFEITQVWNELWPLLVIASIALTLAYIMFTRHLK